MSPHYQPPGTSSEGRQFFTPVLALLWMMGAFFSMVALAVLGMAVAPQMEHDLVSLGVISCVAFLLVTVFLIGRYPAGPRLSQAIGVRPTHPWAIFVGLFLGLAVKVPAEQLSAWIERLYPRTPEQLAALEGVLEADSPMKAAGILFVIGGLVPLSEEIFFRGAVYGALRRGKTRERAALFVTAIGFTLCHADLRQMLPLFFVALMLGALRTYSGSLLPGVAAHVGFNAVAVLGVTYQLLPDFETLSLGLRLGASLLVVILLVVLVKLIGRDPLSLLSRTEEMSEAPSEALPGGERG